MERQHIYFHRYFYDDRLSALHKLRYLHRNRLSEVNADDIFDRLFVFLFDRFLLLSKSFLDFFRIYHICTAILSFLSTTGRGLVADGSVGSGSNDISFLMLDEGV